MTRTIPRLLVLAATGAVAGAVVLTLRRRLALGAGPAAEAAPATAADAPEEWITVPVAADQQVAAGEGDPEPDEAPVLSHA